ncbi:17275_t:CDS:2 [Cetraspora pellucida]|uniref:17275_t:CDS:1 n=1 Tax=Cetraspora pellucida TaxID=1433469 RepID=A0A9N9DIK9_9GLOM|nr:17275_t:CDS:2 [Cetraspora pellucida]
MVTIENFDKSFYDSDNESYLEQNDIDNIRPTFSELQLEEFDETDNIICQNVQELQEECRNMSHDDLDIWIKGQLASFAYSELPKQKKKLQELDNLQFMIVLIIDIICLSTYLKLIGISSSCLDQIKAHIKNYGMAKPVHDHAIINDQVKQELNYYIHKYANFYGFPSPVRHMRHDAMSIVLLPINTTYNSIYEKYISTIKFIKSEDYKAMAYTTFLKIWKEVAPDIQFMTKASDLCDTCEQLYAKIRYANNLEIFISLESNGLKEEAIIRNSVYFDPYQYLNIIPLKPLSLKRQTQLFKDIRPYIHNLTKINCALLQINNKNRSKYRVEVSFK